MAAFSSFAKLAKKVSAWELLSGFLALDPSPPLCVPCWPGDPITHSKSTSLCLAWSLSSSKEAQPCTTCSPSEEHGVVGWRQELRPHLQPAKSKPLRTSVVCCYHGNCWGKHLAEREPAKAHWSNSEGRRGHFRDRQGAIREAGAGSEPARRSGPDVLDRPRV